MSGIPRTDAYSHPVLLVKDNKKGGASRVELLVKGTTPQRKPSHSLRMGNFGNVGFTYHRECHSSYSDEEEEERRRSALAAASGGLRTAGRFLSRFSVSSSSSGSSSSSSSGSISSSSVFSSDNDSSYSSEDEDSSTLMLQSCLSSHRGLLQPPEPSSSSRSHQQSFVAKAVAVPNSKGGPLDQVSNSKSLKRKECSNSASKSSKDFMKKPRMLPEDTFVPRPKTSPFFAGRQVWRWSGNPTQVRTITFLLSDLHWNADSVEVRPFLSSAFPETGSEGQGQETFLQGNRARKRHGASWGLCRVPLSWTSKPPLHRTNRELLGILDLQHGGQSQVVLPPGRNQTGQEASGWQGEPR